jgi:hypothetical protein
MEFHHKKASSKNPFSRQKDNTAKWERALAAYSMDAAKPERSQKVKYHQRLHGRRNLRP